MEPGRPPESLLAHDAFMRRVSRQLLRDANDAEDAVQQTWLAAMQRSKHSSSPLRSWLATVLRNFARKMHRGAERRLQRELRAARPEGVPSASEIAEREKSRAVVLDAVMRLADVYRDAILLRYYENCAPREAARRLGVPVETLRTRVKRGLALLRNELEREFGDSRRWYLALLPIAAVPAPPRPPPWLRPFSTSHPQGGVPVSTMMKIAMAVVLTGAAGAWYFARQPSAPPVGGATAIPIDAAAQLEGPITTQRAVVAASAQPKSEHGGGRDRVGGGDTGTIIVQVLFADGTPAPAVGIEVMPWAFMQPSVHCVYGATGADGTCRFEGVPAGRVSVRHDRPLGGEGVDLVAGTEQQVTLKLPPQQWTVVGTVVDDAGAVVAHAAIWFQATDGPGQVITQSDAGGAFAIRNVERLGWVSARAAGRTPSPGVMLATYARDPSQPIAVDLVIGGAAASVEGQVLAPSGAAVADAVVTIGSEEYDQQTNLLHPSVRLVTDASGHFATDAVRPGTQTLTAKADGYAPGMQTVTIVAGTNATADVTLTQGGTIRGRVTGEDGQVIASAQLYVQGRGVNPELYLQSASDGTFTLTPVPAGKWRVSANQNGKVSAEVTLEVTDGGIIDWNPVLGTTATIRGVVLDDLDRPLVRHQLACCDVGGSLGHARTDAEGHFTLRNLKSGLQMVAVYPPDGPCGAEPLAYVEHVPTGETNVVVRVTEAKLPTAHARGTVLTPDGDPLGSPFASVWVARPWGISSAVAEIDMETGDFDLGPLPPGTYQLKSAAKDYKEQMLAEFTLSSNQVLELGDLHLVK